MVMMDRLFMNKELDLRLVSKKRVEVKVTVLRLRMMDAEDQR
jgi:hypothetical protein